MGEAHRNGNANPSQALKGRNDLAKGKGRGAGITPSITHEGNFAPSGFGASSRHSITCSCNLVGLQLGIDP